MQAAVAQLYVHVLTFLQAALKWYRDSRLVHAVKSVFQPWDLTFRDQYEAIAAASKRIRQMTDVASKAELRDTHLEVLQGKQYWTDAKTEVALLRLENQHLMDMLKTQFNDFNDKLQCKLSSIARPDADSL